MLKNLTSGALINYGPELPSASTAYDGALFYKISAPNAGLYIFGFMQDGNTSTLGDQVTQGWTSITFGDLYVTKGGDTMTGGLIIRTNEGLKLINATQGSGGSVVPNAGVNQGITVSAENGPINFIAGNTQRMSLSTAGVLTLTTGAGNGVVWTNLNDGSGSGLDADLLDGQDSSFYQNAGNITAGTLNASRLPFTPVQQGGGPGQGTNKVNIGWNGANKLLIALDGTNLVYWPIDISGRAATADQATNAVNANTAGTSVSAQYVRRDGDAGGSNMTFRPGGIQGGQPVRVWGSNDENGANNYHWNPANFAVASANQAGNANQVNGIGGWAYSNQPNLNPAYIWATGGNPQQQYLVQPGALRVSYADSANYAASSNYANSAGYAGSAGITGGMIEAIFNNVSCQVLTAALYRCGVLGGGPGGGPVGG